MAFYEHTIVGKQDLSEKDLRIQLAASYRLVEELGWSFLIFGHLTARVPGPEKHFLINPFNLTNFIPT